MKELVNNIQEHLTDKLEELNTVEINWGQLSEEKAPAFFPCALIDLAKVTFSQQRNGYQLAEADIKILLADNCPDEFSFNETDPLQLYGLVEKVHNHLQLFSNGNFAPLQRTSMEKTDSGKNYHGYTVTYQTNFMIPFDNGMRTVPIDGIEGIEIGFI